MTIIDVRQTRGPWTQASQSASAVIGVLGGAGPLATLELHRRVLALAATSGAVQDWDYPSLLVRSAPLAGFGPHGFMSGEAEDVTAQAALVDAAGNLMTGGATEIVIACITAHRYLTAIRAAVPLPVLDLVETAAQYLPHHARRVGVLASRSTVSARLFERALPNRDVVVPDATGQSALDTAILAAMAGQRTAPGFAAAAMSLFAQDVDAIVLGCTELPLLKPFDTDLPVIDILQVAAEAITNTREVTS